MPKVLVISACTANKNDTVPIPENAKKTDPTVYLSDNELADKLKSTRELVFSDPRANVGQRSTYAFDLYIPAGYAYRHLPPSVCNTVKQLIASESISWFFLSGGYGLIHALEPATDYNITFNPTIAYQNKILCSTKYWRETLSDIIDSAVEKFNPDDIFFFGSKDYTSFFKSTNTWQTVGNAMLFESTGSAGPHWLSPIIGKLAKAIINGDIDTFKKDYQRFNKQDKGRI